MAKLEDLLPPERINELTAIHEAAREDPEWYVETTMDLKYAHLTEGELATEITRAWERKKSRERVNAARRKQNQTKHDRLLKRHRDWKPNIDPDRGE